MLDPNTSNGPDPREKFPEAGAEDTEFQETWTEDAQVQETWTEDTEVQEAWAEDTEVQEAWTEDTQVQETWTEDAQVQETWTEDTQVQDALTEDTEVQEAWAEDTEVQEAWTEDTQVQEAWAEDTQVREARGGVSSPQAPRRAGCGKSRGLKAPAFPLAGSGLRRSAAGGSGGPGLPLHRRFPAGARPGIRPVHLRQPGPGNHSRETACRRQNILPPGEQL